MAMGVGIGSTTSSKLRRAARKMVVGIAACGSFSSRNTPLSPPAAMSDSPLKPKNKLEVGIEANSITNIKDLTSKNICAICLEVLSYSSGSSPGQAIFTAQCSHAFHFSCISSNVRHGSITCPICRAHWTQLPRNLNPPACSLSCNQNDPVFRILDDSIATFRVHRRSLLRSARYDDDDPIGPDHTQNHPRIDLALIPLQPTVLTNPCCVQHQHQPSSHSSLQMLGIGHISNHHHHHHQFSSSSSSTLQLQPPSGQTHTYMCSSSNSRPAYLSIKLAPSRATDMVLIASPNGPHLRLLKQSMALVVFSLQPIDRLAIVTYSSAAARVFPLRRMTSYGKRSALQVIDRLFYMGEADPIEGIKKGIKILEDRAHKNPLPRLLHLSDSPTRSYHTMNLQLPLPVHRFHVGFGFGTSNGFVMHEFEEFLTQLLGGVVREVQFRIGEEGRIIRLGDLRGGEERRILIDWGECVHVSVGYSYVEGGSDECIKTGETMVSVEDKRETEEDSNRESGISIVGGRTSSAENWDYRDPYMARRWAKHFHGYRGYEVREALCPVREALRAQMEVQSKLHLQVEAEKHLQIRQDAERKYMAMLERACKMLSDHFIGSGAVTNTDNLEVGSKMLRNYSVDALGFYSTQSADVLNACGQEEMPSGLHSQRADGSTESCLTLQESPGGLTMEGSPVGGKKKMLNLEATTGSVIRGDARVNPQGLTGYGM